LNIGKGEKLLKREGNLTKKKHNKGGRKSSRISRSSIENGGQQEKDRIVLEGKSETSDAKRKKENEREGRQPLVGELSGVKARKKILLGTNEDLGWWKGGQAACNTNFIHLRREGGRQSVLGYDRIFQWGGSWGWVMTA